MLFFFLSLFWRIDFYQESNMKLISRYEKNTSMSVATAWKNPWKIISCYGSVFLRFLRNFHCKTYSLIIPRISCSIQQRSFTEYKLNRLIEIHYKTSEFCKRHQFCVKRKMFYNFILLLKLVWRYIIPKNP